MPPFSGAVDLTPWINQQGSGHGVQQQQSRQLVVQLPSWYPHSPVGSNARTQDFVVAMELSAHQIIRLWVFEALAEGP